MILQHLILQTRVITYQEIDENFIFLITVECSVIFRPVPDFGGQFWPIFGNSEEEFFDTTGGSLFDENSLNKLYIRISVVGID